MNQLRSVIPGASILAVLLCGFAPTPPALRVDTPILVTAAPVFEELAALHGGERFPQGAQLWRMTGDQAEPLVGGFFATADANVSFDATRVLFAGKQIATDPWQIWEMTLSTRAVRKITSTAFDEIRPLYLPNNRLVYAQRMGDGFHIEAAGLDGAATLPLTYSPASALPVDVLQDGRILFEAGFPLGSGDTPELFLVYSDGSGVESYRCDHGNARWGGRQLASGDVVFTRGTSLARFTSPQAAEVSILAPRATYAGDIAETPSGALIVSVKAETASRYSLKLWKPGTAAMQTLFSRESENLVEPAMLLPRATPDRHPSALHPWTTANLLALDARQSRGGALVQTPATVRLESADAAGHVVVMGTAPVEPDGSFFVKVSGDRPLRFALLDAQGKVLRQEHGWFWSRGGEQRICVGCHTGPERAPENRVPGVLLRTTTPVDLSGGPASASSSESMPGGTR